MSIQAKYVLKNPNANKSTSIQFYFYKQKKKFKYSLGLDCMIHPALWDKKAMCPLSLKSNINREIVKKWKNKNPNIETHIHNVRSRINDVERFTNSFIGNSSLHGEDLNFDELRDYLNDQCKPIKRTSKSEKTESLLKYLSSFIKGMEEGKILITSRNGAGKVYRPNTIKAYKALETILNEYLVLKKLGDLKFEKINDRFYKDFQQYIYGLGFTPNHFGNLIKNIKHIMKRAQLDRLHLNEDYKRFKKTSNESDSIALTESEVQRMFDYKFTDEPKLEKYRDIFLIGVYSAMRFSDYSRLDKTNFKTLDSGEFVIVIKHKKTGKNVIIPVKSELMQIMERYDYELPKVSEQKMNVNIKLVGEKIKLKKEITVTKYKGAKEKEICVPKYKLITSHTARRTGCTLFYKAGIPTIDIMMLSGHSTEKEFLNYIKIGAEDTAIRIASNPYFKKSKSSLKVVS